MALNIKDPETDQLARKLAELTGEKITVAVKEAIKLRLDQERRRRCRSIDRNKVGALVERITTRPLVDGRSPDEIIGYDERGLPR